MTIAPAAPEAAPAAADPRRGRRDLRVLMLGWLSVSAVLTFLAVHNLAVPGLNYDEAMYGHFAKNFLMDHQDQVMPASQVVRLFGRPFPLFLQGYLGALKSWMLLPGLALFGFSMAALRMTIWAWALVALLFYMLWLRRLLGSGPAVLGGFVLGLDPSFYFVSICDWGPVVPGFLCRVVGFYFAVKWWQDRRGRDLFFAGLALGLGLFSKIDFVVVLAGCALALLAVDRARIFDLLRRRPRQALGGLIGFLLGAGLMAKNALIVLGGVLGGGVSRPTDAIEKASTFRTMFDGSYFYRLIENGGHFDRMFDTSVPVWSPFGLIFALAFAFLGVIVLRGIRRRTPERLPAFLLLSSVLILLGTWLLPGAIRIHHWTLIDPLPHAVLATAAARLWRRQGAAPVIARGGRLVAALAVAAVLGGHLAVIQATERLLAETGGRGLWSNALNAFAAEVRARSDLTIVSYDWGFNEQLAFLTDGPRLVEPIWYELPAGRFTVPTSPDVIHLVHPPDGQVFPLSGALLRRVSATDPRKVSVRAYNDRTGRTAFYAIRFLGG